MIHIHKTSPVPLSPWNALRKGGENTLVARNKGAYLVLWNADVVHQDGLWHYVFDFDTRESLQKSSLALMLQPGPAAYEGGVDWRDFLGSSWEVIDEERRASLLMRVESSGQVKISFIKIDDNKPMPRVA